MANISYMQAFNAIADEEILVLISKFKSNDINMDEIRGVPVKKQFATLQEY